MIFFMHEIRFLNRNSTSILQDTILLYLGRIMAKQRRVNFNRPLRPFRVLKRCIRLYILIELQIYIYIYIYINIIYIKISPFSLLIFGKPTFLYTPLSIFTIKILKFSNDSFLIVKCFHEIHVQIIILYFSFFILSITRNGITKEKKYFSLFLSLMIQEMINNISK